MEEVVSPVVHKYDFLSVVPVIKAVNWAVEAPQLEAKMATELYP